MSLNLMAESDPAGWPLPLALIAFATAFFGIWTFAGFIVSRFGWSRFAAAYGQAVRPAGRGFLSPSTRFRHLVAAYRNVVRVVPGAGGLWFEVQCVFRAGHAPFLLPWASVRGAEVVSGLWFRGYELWIEDPCGLIRVRLGTDFGEAMAAYRPDLVPATPGHAAGSTAA